MSKRDLQTCIFLFSVGGLSICTNICTALPLHCLKWLFILALSFLGYHCLSNRTKAASKNPYSRVGTYFEKSSYFTTAKKKYALYSMNVIWTYIRHVVIITWPTSVSRVASLPFTNLSCEKGLSHLNLTLNLSLP